MNENMNKQIPGPTLTLPFNYLKLPILTIGVPGFNQKNRTTMSELG